MGGQQTQGPMMPAATPTPDPNVPSWATPQDIERAKQVQKMLQMQNMLGGTGGPPKLPPDPMSGASPKTSPALQKLISPKQRGTMSPLLAENYKRNQQWARMGPYWTDLSPQEEQQYQQWASSKGIPADDPTYDNRGFWRGLMQGDPRAKTGVNPSDQTVHGPDTWKTPYHDSFSNESIYAMPDAPRWVGSDDTGYSLQDKSGRVIFDERMSRQR